MHKNWIRCTLVVGGPIYVNVAAASTLKRHSGDETRIAFPGDGNDFIDVRETPEEILEQLRDD
ncbi:hypothetical protein SAMN06265365_103125 [Tistlia consotensis]|uniref:Uncharacterized protein n=1 Tax=Tistlia consotensis USBA 355 TaxID=560819 RepID=A0A1Y6BL98_9PROT|nr:hypothetical protein [Tistlia consotensis]SMF17458.1 hypothetical protein SAMN05428998_106102 [Tistlia consotensis USBA 355]SNR40427.1 hypothetical protein SAMN06265365_103125 [Tistlia consotensis]